ncbi:helix-turn-helix domain-containing protein [Streptomyces sp. TRM66268-LWL]|uniref:Helix-turn-helix domain-containing protein n=1 Tax=Streptomyces polyasparticus TaxID=2767826 RepID=A0ABR7SR51_9ACTN|nr:helix-turn-helix transcriptional regulator [Streptomyces polyasparticus]MBC9716798.1 helix-turn-helix domain-containing protein [Streptomyces polyasparticus]
MHSEYEEPDPSDSLRTFGAVVHALREHTGLSREEFAARVGFSKHTVVSIELGRRMPDRDFVDRAEPALGNTGALRRSAQHLSRQPGLAAWFRQWAKLEQEATRLDTYECRLVPGLLQCEAYARTVFANAQPPLDDARLEAQVTARMERQRLLRERPCTSFSFIIEEHIFQRQLGGPDVTRLLLDHVLACTEPRNVVLQIMPIRSSLHAALDGPIQLLETADQRRLAYSEGQKNGRLIADPKEAAALHDRYATLRSQAPTPEDSRSLLERMRGAP